MSVLMRGEYLGDKKVALFHEESGTRILTAAPRDNNGDGSSFSPTDLCAASLGACVQTILGIVAERDAIDLTGSFFTVRKEMSPSPRRIGVIDVVLHLPEALTPDQRVKLERAGNTCPVHHSLHPDVTATVTYLYDVSV